MSASSPHVYMIAAALPGVTCRFHDLHLERENFSFHTCYFLTRNLFQKSHGSLLIVHKPDLGHMPVTQLLTIMVNEVTMIGMGQSNSCSGFWEFLKSTWVYQGENWEWLLIRLQNKEVLFPSSLKWLNYLRTGIVNQCTQFRNHVVSKQLAVCSMSLLILDVFCPEILSKRGVMVPK